jgi:hypothetical protein
MIISAILGFLIFSYISCTIALYLDARYDITDVGDKKVDLLFASIMGLFVVAVVAFYSIKKLNFKFDFHNKIIELGEKHGKQDKDPTYQLEKAVFGEKR